MTPALRSASAADATAVAELLIEGRRVFQPYAPSPHPDDDVRRWVAEALIPAKDVTVAVAEGRIVGVLATSHDGTRGWIEQLFVTPDGVGTGIGHRLLDHAHASLGRPIRLYTFEPNARARRFYEAHGYRAIAFGDGSGNEERCPDVLYELAALPR